MKPVAWGMGTQGCKCCSRNGRKCKWQANMQFFQCTSKGVTIASTYLINLPVSLSLSLSWSDAFILIVFLAGDSIILNCQADGTPTPEILWYKDANPVEPSPTVGIFNDGTELRISTIRHEDIGEYTCIARNGEGQVSHTARVIIAGGAVIMVKT